MYQHKRFITLMTICALAILATAALLSLAGSGRGLTVQAAPASPTVNTISSDTTWGPGVVTITSDVVITNGATLVVKPGTTVIVGTWAVPTDTAPYVGGVSDRVEIIVANGRLVADGYVTATQLITPYQTITFTNGTLGDPPWWGIRILHASAAVSESIVSFARIEWGTYGISIDNASPTVTHNCITNMNGAWGSNGENGPAGTDGADGTASTNATDGTPGGDGSPGGNGSPAYGIYVTGANSAPLIAHNEINDVTGGQGGWGGSGGKGGKGGDGYSPTDPNVGDGGDGARGAAGGDGAPGGDGGDAAGIYVQDASPTIYHNTITKIRPGNAAWGGSGGNGGAGGNGGNANANPGETQYDGGNGGLGEAGGAGGDSGHFGRVWGIYVAGGGTMDVRSNTVTNIGTTYTLLAGRGGDGGDGGDAGSGTCSYSAGTVCGDPGTANHGGDGGAGGNGQDGNLAAGIYVANGVRASVVDNRVMDIVGGEGAYGGRGGDGGQGGQGGFGTAGSEGSYGGQGGRAGDAGDGGQAIGIGDPSATMEVRRNTVWSVHGGYGGFGLRGGAGGAGGAGGDAGSSNVSGGGDGGAGGDAGNSGNGGDGGDAIGILSESTADVENNVIYSIDGGSGASSLGTGGSGGGGGAGGQGYDTSDGGDGGDGGAGGDGGNGGDAGMGIGAQATGSNAAVSIINNTVTRLSRGGAGSAGTPGVGGTGGAPGPASGAAGSNPGAPGADGPDGTAGQAGAESGTVGLHVTAGATAQLYNNIVARTTYTTPIGINGTFTNSVGISGTNVTALDYNDVWGWETNYRGVTTGTHDISQDPLFTDVFCGDCEDFGPEAGSPCVDAASNDQSPSDDRDNVFRPQDGDGDHVAVTDIGAYERFFTDTFTVTCGASGVYTTTDGRLTLEWGSGQCTTCTITMTYTALGSPTGGTGDLASGNLAFRLEAVDCHGDPVVMPTPPLTLTLHYDDLLPAGMEEESIQLYRWDAPWVRWVTMTTLDRDTTAHTLTIRLDHLSDFALLGPGGGGNTIYLPLVLRQ